MISTCHLKSKRTSKFSTSHRSVEDTMFKIIIIIEELNNFYFKKRNLLNENVKTNPEGNAIIMIGRRAY